MFDEAYLGLDAPSRYLFYDELLADYAAHPDGAFSWRFQRDLAGSGVLGDLLSHGVDLAHLLAGPIAAVTATTGTSRALLRTRGRARPDAVAGMDLSRGSHRSAARMSNVTLMCDPSLFLPVPCVKTSARMSGNVLEGALMR
jgi:hypothetical protein